MAALTIYALFWIIKIDVIWCLGKPGGENNIKEGVVWKGGRLASITINADTQPIESTRESNSSATATPTMKVKSRTANEGSSMLGRDYSKLTILLRIWSRGKL